MLETLAPFYGVDPEIQEIPGPPRESAAWLRSALDGAEERVRDLEAELAERSAPVPAPVPATSRVVEREEVVRAWLEEDREKIDPEARTALHWAYDLVLGRLEELGA